MLSQTGQEGERRTVSSRARANSVPLSPAPVTSNKLTSPRLDPPRNPRQLVRIHRMDPRRQSISRIIRQPHRLLLGLEPQHRCHRPKDLLSPNHHLVRHSREHRRLDKVTLGTDALASGLELGFFGAGLDVGEDLVELDFGDEGAVERIGGFADFDVLDGGDEQLEELVVDLSARWNG